MSDPTDEQLAAVIRELLTEPREATWFEFKNNNDDPETIGKNVSGLSNAAALAKKPFGYIVFGIDDGDHRVVGTTVRLESKTIGGGERGGQDFTNWLRGLVDPTPATLIRDFTINGQPIGIIRFPAAAHTPTAFKKVRYIRVGPHTVRLDRHPDLEEQLWKRFDSTPFESRIALGDLSPADVTNLLDHAKYFDLLGEPAPDTRTAVLEQLERDAMLVRDPGSRWSITNLGGLLFAKDLNEFPGLKRKALRIIRYTGTDKLHTERERSVTPAPGYAVGFESAIEYITAALPASEYIGPAFRETRGYPPAAIRELLPNALIHQDFGVQGAGPVVEIYADRLEISNPGAPLIEVQRFLDHPPRSRNEALASFMRRINICEERGSGIDKVVASTELALLPAPLFETPGDNTLSVLFGPRAFGDMETDDLIRACYWHACLLHFSHKPLTNQSLRKRFGLEPSEGSRVSRIIRKTLDATLIKKASDPGVGTKKWAYAPFWA